MDVLKLHILINYYPAIGIIIATLLLGGGMWFGRNGAKRFALKLFVALAVLTFCVALAGEAASWTYAAESGERMAALSGHKHFATTALAATVITGILSVIGLTRRRNDKDRRSSFYAIVLVLAIAASTLLVLTILRGRNIKWAVSGHNAIFTRLIVTENNLWHA